MREPIKYFSMFSGIGGFEYGMEQSDYEFECVGYSEIDKYARSIYEKHYPNHINYGDATQINTRDLPSFEFLVGGFPCQAFSTAGKRKGFEDSRGTLFFEIARILKDKKPTYFLLENVKGLLSHDRGRTIQTIFRVCDELGYDVSWAVYNSKDYGVPQNRERIFIKGYSRTSSGGEVLSVPRVDKAVDEPMSNTYYGVRSGRGHKEDDIMNTLACSGHNGGSSQLIQINDKKQQAERVYDSDGLACTLSANGEGQGGKTGLYKINTAKVQMPVKKRVHTANINELQQLLRKHKKQTKLTNKQISQELKQPQTLVEHWFRNDKSFSIPDSNIWFDLKALLKITDNSFDDFITKFEVVDGKYDMANRVYSDEGISPTLNCNNNGLYKINKIGNVSPSNHHNGDVFSTEGIGRTLCARDYKDAMKIVQPVLTPERENKRQNGRRMKDNDEEMFTLTATDRHGVYDGITVRKLTPVECERLQGFPDNWTKYGKDDELISDTQRYKCCGNAVTTNVITAIINEMFKEVIEDENDKSN